MENCPVIFHGYVSHNQMVIFMGWINTKPTISHWLGPHPEASAMNSSATERRWKPMGCTGFWPTVIWSYPIGSMYGIYTNIKGVYWWDPWHTIYSSTMDPSCVFGRRATTGLVIEVIPSLERNNLFALLATRWPAVFSQEIHGNPPGSSISSIGD